MMKRTSNAIIMARGRILVGKRPKTKKCYPGVWDIIGGHMEKGESPKAAMVREVKEEVGIDVTKSRFLMKFYDTDHKSRCKYLHYIYVVTDWHGRIRNLTDLERLLWADKAAVKRLKFSPREREILLKVLE